MFKNVNIESCHRLFPILRQFKLIGMALMEKGYPNPEIDDLASMIINLAEQGLDALDKILLDEPPKKSSIPGLMGATQDKNRQV